jgi:hypothetical protein
LKIVQTVLLSCFLLLFGSELAAQVKAALKVPFADSVINKGKDTVKKNTEKILSTFLYETSEEIFYLIQAITLLSCMILLF